MMRSTRIGGLMILYFSILLLGLHISKRSVNKRHSTSIYKRHTMLLQIKRPQIISFLKYLIFFLSITRSYINLLKISESNSFFLFQRIQILQKKSFFYHRRKILKYDVQKNMVRTVKTQCHYPCGRVLEFEHRLHNECSRMVSHTSRHRSP